MSLLLDALKKAAEQKAEKSRHEAAAATPSNETDVTAIAEGHPEPGQDVEPGSQQTTDAGKDETELDISETKIRPDRGRNERELADETDLGPVAQKDDTDIGEPLPADDASETPPGPGTKQANDDEDMSLLLVDRDDANLTRPGPATGQRAPQGTGSLEEPDDGLALVDRTQLRVPEDLDDAPEQTSSTATAGIATETRRPPGITSQTDNTSTHTYAPDNYDRTLMQPPSGDESRIFAGMKSDADVVMTPDYAKRVFRSKSSVQRVQAYKNYLVIGVVILLATGMYGVFEFQGESSKIDTSLLPLKRDPMPDIINPEDRKQDADLFAESVGSERTIEIIENAGNAAETGVVDEGSATNQAEMADETMASEAVASAETTVETDSSRVVAGSATVTRTEPAETVKITNTRQIETATAQPEKASSTLKITSGSRIGQKHLWLAEAYEAYTSGNDSLAITRYNQVLEIDPGNRNALLARAAISVQNNNNPAAIKDYQTLLMYNPKDSLAMTSLITVANYSPVETESQLKLMIRDEPDSPYLNFALANAYGALNRWQEAQGYYFKALENSPGDPNYAYNLAVSLEHISQPAQAVAYYQRALDNIGNGLASFSREVVSQRMEALAKQ